MLKKALHFGMFPFNLIGCKWQTAYRIKFSEKNMSHKYIELENCVSKMF